MRAHQTGTTRTDHARELVQTEGPKRGGFRPPRGPRSWEPSITIQEKATDGLDRQQ